MNKIGYANMVPGNEGLSWFIHTTEVLPLLLLAICALPQRPGFEASNEDLPLTED